MLVYVVFFLFVYLFVHFFAPVCTVQGYACLLVVSSVLTGRRQKSILIRYFSKMKKKSVKNYRTVFVMSEQFSLPKINLILQKLKKGPLQEGKPFNISCLPPQRTIAPLEEKNSLPNNMHLLVYYRIPGKLPHHPSLMVTFSLDWKVCVEVRLREGWVGSLIQEVDYYFTWLVFDVQPIVWSDVHLFSPSYRQ